MSIRQQSVCAAFICLAALCTGCQTGPLGGTRWNVVEVVDPDPEDRAALEDVTAITVEFRKDGRIVTTMIHDDGSATYQDDERYSVSRDVIKISHPDYELTAAYRFDEGQLRVHSQQFLILMNPIEEKQ